MNHHHFPHATAIFGSQTGGSLAWILDQLFRYGPSWSLVPPLMFGSASLCGAWLSLRRTTQDLAIARSKAMRDAVHAEAVHQARLERIRLTGVDPGAGLESLGVRS